jgi:hypothetical protein
MCEHRNSEAPATIAGPEMKNVMKDGLMGIKHVAQLDNADEVNEHLARGWSLITT